MKGREGRKHLRIKKEEKKMVTWQPPQNKSNVGPRKLTRILTKKRGFAPPC